MKEGYRPLASVAGGFLLAIAIVVAISVSHAVQSPSTNAEVATTTTAAPSAVSGPLFAANNSAGRSLIQPRPNVSSTSTQVTPGQSNIQTIAKPSGPSILITVMPLLVAIVLGIGVHQLSARRIEREE